MNKIKSHYSIFYYNYLILLLKLCTIYPNFIIISFKHQCKYQNAVKAASIKFFKKKRLEISSIYNLL